MSKVLQMIDFEHLMDYEQYIRIEYMIEKDMREESYVNPDGPMAQAGFLEDEPLHSDNDDVDFDDPFRKHVTRIDDYDDIPF